MLENLQVFLSGNSLNIEIPCKQPENVVWLYIHSTEFSVSFKHMESQVTYQWKCFLHWNNRNIDLHFSEVQTMPNFQKSIACISEFWSVKMPPDQWEPCFSLNNPYSRWKILHNVYSHKTRSIYDY